jgi:NTE family protein
MVEANEGGRLGLVLSGGGARGAFQVGVYERLLEDQRFRDPMALSGTSAGSINAALIAAGKSPAQMRQFWREIADDPPVKASAVFFETATWALLQLLVDETYRLLTSAAPWRDFIRHVRNHLPPRPGSLAAVMVEYILTTRFEVTSKLLEGIREPFLADTSRLRQRLADAIGSYVVPSNGAHLAINTVDARTGQVVRYVTRKTPWTRPPNYEVVPAITVDMVLASASIPLLFPAVPVDQYLLWDGGLLVNTPLAPVVALGAQRIVTVLVTGLPPNSSPRQFSNFGEAVERTVDCVLENAYNVDRKLLLERNETARHRDRGLREVSLYLPIRPPRDACFDVGSYLYFERSILDRMHDAGRHAADAWLQSGPQIDYLPTPDEEDDEDIEPTGRPVGNVVTAFPRPFRTS